MLTVVQGDLTRQDVDVVVNAANAQLSHGGGVAAAIARAAGPDLDRQSRAWVDEHGPVRPGQAAVTTAGAMRARHVVHVVGPVHEPGQDNAALLARAVTAALDAAAGLAARSVALPAISAGIFGYPLDEATAVIARTCREWLDGHDGTVGEIRLVGYDRAAADAFRAVLAD